MPLDAICISALSRELESRLSGAKIDKIQQPERDMLLISLRGRGENLRLLLSAGTGCARVHITETAFENPAEPPMFCMLMRKHLAGGRILYVRQPEQERMLMIGLLCRDELGVEAEKQLIIEMIGRSPNLVLVGPDGRIIDCMRRADFAAGTGRAMLPGMIYRLPPKQEKIPFFTISSDQLEEAVKNAPRDIPPNTWLLRCFSGLSPLICRELSCRCGEDYGRLYEQLEALRDSVREAEFSPVLLIQDGKALDFSFMRLAQYGKAVEYQEFESFSALLDAFYSRRDRAEQRRKRAQELQRRVKTMKDRLSRKLALQSQELERGKDRESVRIRAELVAGNIYRLKKGDRALECEDYYQEGCPRVKIELDPLKSPQQNAASLFKEYNKLKGAAEHLAALVEEGQKQLDYLESVLDEIFRAETEKDLAEIRRELENAGFIKPDKNKKAPKAKPLPPQSFLSDDGFEILAGRSNHQNDELTTKLARRTDYWLHVQKLHGSHVIIRCEGLEPPEKTLEQAAVIAAYHSQARCSGKTAVDWTMVRNVRKPSGALPGKVIYTDYGTLIVQSDEALVQRLKR